MKTKANLISISLTLIFVLIGVILNIFTKNSLTNQVQTKNMNSYNEVTKEDIVLSNIEENYYIYEFYANMFGISIDDIKKELSNNDYDFNEFDLNNEGICYNTLEESLYHYLVKLESEKKYLFNRKYKYKKVNKEYIYGLIDYFSIYFDNVDTVTAKAIACLESGNLNAQNMMLKNNIFGGMSNNSLIKYPSIEYGVYRYMKLLSSNYYGQGLNTLEKIVMKYNPVIINGKKHMNYQWVNEVNGLKSKFKSQNITLLELIEME